MASFVEVGGHAGDEGNFEALYETYKHDVQRLASYLLKNAHDAEDAAQTVFMNVLRALRQGVTPADPRAWLLTITRNVCFSRGRAAAARPDYVELDFETPTQPTDDQTPSADEIVGALARMRPNQRTALILRDFRGVSRAEISDLMSLSSVSVEALLTRARAAFRDELSAGNQPFVCEETRKLVEQQLDGEITVADRHSLRTHLRHCSPCSTLARAVRSSRSKVAGLLFWPFDLISRLASAFSQAPAVAHVAVVITSTAAVASVAIPVAISTGPSVAHVEGRTAPGPAAAVVAPPRTAAAATNTAPAASAPAVAAARVVTHAFASHAVVTRKAAHSGTHAAAKHSSKRAVAAKSAAASPATASAPVTSAPVASTPASGTTGSIHTPTGQVTAHPVVQSSPRTIQPVTTPHSVSPAARPTPRSKPGSKPSHKSPKRPKHHAPTPPDRMPSSSPPAASMPPAVGGATNGAGPGFSTGSPAVSPAVVPSAPPSSSQSNTGSSGSSGNGNGSAGSNGNGHGKHHK